MKHYAISELTLKFYENLHKNLTERFSEFYGKEPVDHFDVVETADIKPKRIMICRQLQAMQPYEPSDPGKP